MKNKTKSLIRSLLAILPFTVPLVAFAQKKDLNYIIKIIADYLNKALLLLMGLAVLMFVWYIVKYFIRPSEDRKEGSKYLMWSVIGFFIILSFWGIVNVLINTFQLAPTPTSWEDYFNIFPTR